MKANTIKLALRTQIKAIIDSVDDPEVKRLMSRDTMICGGAIASMLAGEKPNDYDIYFKTLETAEAVATYYCNKFNESQGRLKSRVFKNCNPKVRRAVKKNIKGEDEERILIHIQSSGVASEGQEEYDYFESRPEEEASDFVESLSILPSEASEVADDVVEDLKNKEKYRPIFFSDNAITLSNKIQVVLRFYGEPEEIFKNYDYAHCMCSFDYSKNSLALHHEALESILAKALFYRGSLYPIASLFRIRKFIKRGWSITAGQMLKIIWQISELDLENKELLNDQLIGVDQAYMSQLISVLQNKEPGVKVDSIYIAKIVDEIFD